MVVQHQEVRDPSLPCTNCPGAIIDLSGFYSIPAGLDNWEPIWKRGEFSPAIVEPRVLEVVRLHLGLKSTACARSRGGRRRARCPRNHPTSVFLARALPQWFRCTGCDHLGPMPRLNYTNSHPPVRKLAQFTHQNCPGKQRQETGPEPPDGRARARRSRSPHADLGRDQDATAAVFAIFTDTNRDNDSVYLFGTLVESPRPATGAGQNADPGRLDCRPSSIAEFGGSDMVTRQ